MPPFTRTPIFDGPEPQVNFVTGEMKHASRDLPRVIHTAMPTVIISYLLANVAYYLVLPGAVIGQSNTVAVVLIPLTSLLPPLTL